MHLSVPSFWGALASSFTPKQLLKGFFFQKSSVAAGPFSNVTNHTSKREMIETESAGKFMEYRPPVARASSEIVRKLGQGEHISLTYSLSNMVRVWKGTKHSEHHRSVKGILCSSTS